MAASIAPTVRPRRPSIANQPVQPPQAGLLERLKRKLEELPWLSIVILVLLGISQFRSRPQLPAAAASPPAPVVTTTPPAVDVGALWNSAARWVETGQIEETDDLVKACVELKGVGLLTDLSRIDVYAKGPNQHIDQKNRAEVLRVLRGG